MSDPIVFAAVWCVDWIEQFAAASGLSWSAAYETVVNEVRYYADPFG